MDKHLTLPPSNSIITLLRRLAIDGVLDYITEIHSVSIWLINFLKLIYRKLHGCLIYAVCTIHGNTGS